MDIVIIGLGRFGSALAHVYESKGLRVHTVNRDDPWPFKDIKKAPPHAVFITVQTQSIPEMWGQRAASLLSAPYIVSTAKGLIKKFSQTPVEYLGDVLGRKFLGDLFVYSGPSFAKEVLEKKPTALVLASQNSKALTLLSKLLSAENLRIYKSNDPYGVEVCGALKNVYAVASGMSDGMGFGDNTRAALISRALAEMCRICISLGGQKTTAFGLAGAGDLFLTCSSVQSRNYQFGYGLAQGRSSSELLSKLGTVEGAWTATVAKQLCHKRKIRAPLIDTVSDILSGKLAPKDALFHLMTREIRHEFEQ